MKTRFKSRYTVIEFPVFCNYRVHVEVSSDIRRSMAKYPPTEDLSKEDSHGTEACAIHICDEPFSFIFLPYNANVGSIAHEAWHVIRQIMEHTNVELDNEAVAYHLGYLTDGIFKFVHGKKR